MLTLFFGPNKTPMVIANSQGVAKFYNVRLVHWDLSQDARNKKTQLFAESGCDHHYDCIELVEGDVRVHAHVTETSFDNHFYRLVDGRELVGDGKRR